MSNIFSIFHKNRMRDWRKRKALMIAISCILHICDKTKETALNLHNAIRFIVFYELKITDLYQFINYFMQL